MGVVTLFTQQLINSVSVGIFFSSSMVAREQAEMLALGGINLAIVQLQRGMLPEKSERKKVGAKASASFAFPSFIKNVLPSLHRWQTYELKEEWDCLEGTLKVCISPEEGKIPVSLLFDASRGELTVQAKALLRNFSIKKKLASGALIAKLTEFFKKRTTFVQEISELAPVAHALHMPLFYQPPRERGKKKGEPEIPHVALQDLFTTWGNNKTISPLLLSDGMCAVLGLRRPQARDAEKRKERFDRLSEQWASVRGKGSDGIWKVLQVLYDRKPKVSKELASLFSSEIEPRFYSVLSCGVVGGVKQTVLAVLAYEKSAATGVRKQKKADSGKKEGPSRFVLRRLYWV